MYRNYINQRGPTAFWMLDDTVPFQECSGLGASGGKKSGTSDPTTAVPLVAGAAFSSVFNRASVGQFACPLFKQGLEDRPFALESWVLPIQKTSGQVAQTYRENLVSNPSFETALTGWANYGASPTRTRDNTRAAVGSWSHRIVAAATGIQGTYYTGIPVTPGKTYTISSYVYSSTDVVRQNYWFKDSGGASVIGTQTPAAQHVVNTSQQRISFTVTAPAGAVEIEVRWYINPSTLTTNEFWLDGVMMEESNVAGPYFDGNLPGYEWSGTANNSISRTRKDISRINVANPTFNGSGLNALDSVNNVLTQGVSYQGSTWTRGTWNGTGNNVIRQRANQSALSPLATYTATVTLANDSASPVTVQLDWCDLNAVNTTLQPGQVKTLSTSGVRLYDSTYRFSDLTLHAAGTFLFKDFIIEQTSVSKPFFDGNSPGAIWNGAANASESLLLISNSPQQILSHDGVYDGLTIDGKVIRFGTQYTNFGDAFCDYDLVENKLAHVVGIHTEDANQLWVNGELVASVDLTEEQRGDTYTAAATGNLYSGLTISSQEVAMNAVAFYPSLSGDLIKKNYEAGIATIGQDRIASQYGGTQFDLDSDTGAVFFTQTWIDKEDFNEGYKNNVEYAPDQVEPVYDVTTGLSETGSWTVGVPLDIQDDTSIYGVMVSWSGKNVTIETSLDGTTWTPATSGRLVSTITNGYNPTGKDLQIRATFAAGLTEGYLESLTVIGYRNNTVNNIAERSVTVTYPAVLRNDYEPNLYRDDNGIYLNGGSLVIGPDNTTDPDMVRTIEVWTKVLSGSFGRSWSGDSKYANGVLSADAKVGEWTLLHFVLPSDDNSTLTISGDLIVGQVTLYETPFTQADVDHQYRSYTGGAVKRYVDTGGVTVSESATPVKIYAHDWAIDGAG